MIDWSQSSDCGLMM